MTVLLDNFDHNSEDEGDQAKLAQALEWEKAFVDFMHHNVSKYSDIMDIAFNAERSIEDELERETSGDIPTIAASYCLMVVYIVFALGRISRYQKLC